MNEQEKQFAEQLRADKVVMHDDTWAAVHVGNHCYGYPITAGQISKLPTMQYW